MVYGLWTEDDSGLPTGPLTITKNLLNISLTHWTLGLIHVLSLATQTIKNFFVNVPLEPYPMFSLLLSTWNDLGHPGLCRHTQTL